MKLPQMQELYATERLYMPDNRPVASNDTKTMNCGANETLSFTCCTLVAQTPRYRRYRFSDLLAPSISWTQVCGGEIVTKSPTPPRLRCYESLPVRKGSSPAGILVCCCVFGFWILMCLPSRMLVSRCTCTCVALHTVYFPFCHALMLTCANKY